MAEPLPAGDSRFTCSLSLDSYSYTLYAFSFAHLPSLPAPDLNANGEPTGNYVAKLGRYIESLSALAVTEYRGTSSAWASGFAPPSALEYPCAADYKVDGGTKADGGVKNSGLRARLMLRAGGTVREARSATSARRTSARRRGGRADRRRRRTPR